MKFLFITLGLLFSIGNCSEPLVDAGIAHFEFFDESRENRPIVFELVYPAEKSSLQPFEIPFFTDFTVYKDASPKFSKQKAPLIVLSPGRAGNRFHHLWLAAYLAEHGYIVALLDHYFANSYQTSNEYVGTKIWVRPLDISKTIDFLLADKKWGPHIDPSKIGVAGFSQGGFAALWVAGAEINPEKFEKYQRGRINDPLIPQFLKEKMEVSAKPALHLKDPRVKAVFAMSPGMIQAFGFDEEGLKKLQVPTYIIAGEKDSPVPIEENAIFAARHIPNATLKILPGQVDHEIFLNECTKEGKQEYPGSCVDDKSVDRKKIHEIVEQEALQFFNKAFDLKS